jgi:hypothetical protein
MAMQMISTHCALQAQVTYTRKQSPSVSNSPLLTFLAVCTFLCLPLQRFHYLDDYELRTGWEMVRKYFNVLSQQRLPLIPKNSFLTTSTLQLCFFTALHSTNIAPKAMSPNSVQISIANKATNIMYNYHFFYITVTQYTNIYIFLLHEGCIVFPLT